MSDITCCICGENGAHDIRVDSRGTTMPLCAVCERIWRVKRERVLRIMRGRRTA